MTEWKRQAIRKTLGGYPAKGMQGYFDIKLVSVIRVTEE